MKKRIIALALAVCTVFTGCSDKTDSSSSSAEKVQTLNTGTETQETSRRKEDIVITLGLLNEPENKSFTKAIDDFNSADNGCRIETKYMSSRFEEDGGIHGYTEEEIGNIDFNTLQMIMNESGLDIIGGDTFGDNAKYELLKQKGAFVDLYEFMENDPEVNTSALNQHILELNEIDGKLYSIPQFYDVHTVISKSEYGGTKQNWSIDEFIEHWNSMPAGSTIEGSNCAEYIFMELLRENLPAFVDEKNAKVSFDSYDFRKMIEFCKRFPSNNGQKADYDYTAPMLTDNYWIRSVSDAIYTEMNYQTYEQKQYRLREGGYTLVGYPTSDGKGAYLSTSYPGWSISAGSSDEKQEAAWKFIRQFYTEEYQTENCVMKNEYIDDKGTKKFYYQIDTGFCINNDARKKIAENIVSGMYDSDEPVYAQGHEITGGKLKLDEEDCQFIENYVNSIERWDTRVDRELWWIVNDEVMTCLGGGQSVDTTIDMIQNRASLWVSERY